MKQFIINDVDPCNSTPKKKSKFNKSTVIIYKLGLKKLCKYVNFENSHDS